jgi:basic amino acid/polyamine antiporter, APA family
VEDLDEEAPTLQRELTFFDLTNITVGAIIGADIYIAAAITAGLMGPASLVVWAAAAIVATVLALMLAECARIVPDVGGPYAYVSHAFGKFPGFLAGWSMWIAELTAMPVFAIAFTSYLGYFVNLTSLETQALRVSFLLTLTAVNVVSVRVAGRFNDVFYLGLHANLLVENLTPVAPKGWSHFSTALVLVVWAYMGFELSTVPSGEVKDPGKTIPRALATGMLIVSVFYLVTNFVLYALVGYEELAVTSTPLIAGATVLFGSVGAAMMAAGAIVSVSGSDESDMMGASRLGYAMAAAGLLPHRLAAIHSRFRTPYAALMAQAALAIVLSFIDQLASLIAFAVFNLAFAFLLSSLSLFRLQRESRVTSVRERFLPIAGTILSAGLIVATSTTSKLEGVAVLLVGVLVYMLFSPREEMAEAMGILMRAEHVAAIKTRLRFRFLGGLVGWLGGRRSPS